MTPATMLEGVCDALTACSQERDRNGIEIIAPSEIELVELKHRETGEQWVELTTTDGERFRVTVERAS